MYYYCSHVCKIKKNKRRKNKTLQQLFHSKAKLKLSALTLISVTFVVPLFSIQHVMHHETHSTTPIQI